MTSRRRGALWALFLSACARVVCAESAGTETGNFLDAGIGARYLAMGGAGTSLADDADALYWNPACLSYVRVPSLSLMHGVYVDSVRYHSLSYAQPAGLLGTTGISLQSMSAGSIEQMDGIGNSLGSISPRDTALGFGWARAFGRVPLGLGGKFIQSKLVRSASGVVLDAGAGYRRDKIKAALAWRNFTRTGLKFSEETSPLPSSLHAGLSYKAADAWIVSLSLDSPLGGSAVFGTGTEYRIPFTGDQTIFIRGGYQTVDRGAAGFQGVSFGFGWRWSLMDVDYAWVPLGDLGQTHRFSLSFRFGKIPGPDDVEEAAKIKPTPKSAPILPPAPMKEFNPLEYDLDPPLRE